jgi:hypothetical protein
VLPAACVKESPKAIQRLQKREAQKFACWPSCSITRKGAAAGLLRLLNLRYGRQLAGTCQYETALNLGTRSHEHLASKSKDIYSILYDYLRHGRTVCPSPRPSDMCLLLSRFLKIQNAHLWTGKYSTVRGQ